MVIHYFYVICILIAPLETNPPLIVDPNAVLPLSVSDEGLEPIARRLP
jgi:hypothetical protein